MTDHPFDTTGWPPELVELMKRTEAELRGHVPESMRQQLRSLGEIQKLSRILRAESDRGSVLVAASYLDESLKASLIAILVDSPVTTAMFDQQAALGTFSSRISMAFALGMITKQTMSSLNLVRKIRNEFGHEVFTVSDFENPQVKARMAELEARHFPFGGRPRDRFIRVVLSLAAEIHTAPMLMERRTSPADDPEQPASVYARVSKFDEAARRELGVDDKPAQAGPLEEKSTATESSGPEPKGQGEAGVENGTSSAPQRRSEQTGPARRR